MIPLYDIIMAKQEHKRPSHKELTSTLRKAKEALDREKSFFAEPSKAVGELDELGIDNTNDVWLLIRELLDEVTPNDYAGCRPPEQSYERSIMGKELFAFTWRSTKLEQDMYIKFAILDGGYYYVSLHEDRPKR